MANKAPQLLMILNVETEVHRCGAGPDPSHATEGVLMDVFDLCGQSCLGVDKVGIKMSFTGICHEDFTCHPQYNFNMSASTAINAVQPCHLAWLVSKGLF